MNALLSIYSQIYFLQCTFIVSDKHLAAKSLLYEHTKRIGWFFSNKYFEQAKILNKHLSWGKNGFVHCCNYIMCLLKIISHVTEFGGNGDHQNKKNKKYVQRLNFNHVVFLLIMRYNETRWGNTLSWYFFGMLRMKRCTYQSSFAYLNSRHEKDYSRVVAVIEMRLEIPASNDIW